MTNEELHKKYYVGFAAELARSDLFLSEDISDEDAIRKALSDKIDIHMFKRSPRRLPRVVKTIGMLRQMDPVTILEAGCGKGVFLWTLANEFPNLSIHAEDINKTHFERICKVSQRRFQNINAGMVDLEKDDTWLLIPDAYDVVTCLEVLEHIHNWPKAVEYVCKSARKFVIFSFPSKEDNNIEHIHLLDKREVAEVIMQQGRMRIPRFEHVNGHTFVIARKEIKI